MPCCHGKNALIKKPSIALAAAVLLTALAVLCPTRAFASVAHSVDDSGGTTYYYDTDLAIDAGLEGETIIMDSDWSVTGDGDSYVRDVGCITVDAGKKLTIDMNGHRIWNRSAHSKTSLDTPTFSVRKGAELTLKSSTTTEFGYSGYYNKSEDGTDAELGTCQTTTGGLVTNTANDKGGILVCDSGKLTLDNVTVAGCKAGYATEIQHLEGGSTSYFSVSHLVGGVTLGQDATLVMDNGASVEHNCATGAIGGGGVYVEDSGVTISMNGSFIHDNLAIPYSSTAARGGGIYCDADDVNITMDGGSKIYGNTADAGGGIYFYKSSFSLTSSDGEASIEGNTATYSSTGDGKVLQSGGGIHVDGASGTNKGLIENITIANNRSEYDGGGIELDQRATVVRNCTITGNTCRYEGGGICVANDNNKISGCTITGNACNVGGGEGDNYGGGGVFVGSLYDVKLAGLCTVKGNTRGAGSGDADDLFLNEGVAGVTKAYLTGTLAQGSTVGVRDGTEGDRRIAEEFNPESDDCLFIDLDGYYVTYGTDEGGDAWQRKGSREFALSVNGEARGRFANGATATANGASADAAKVFKCWSAEGTTGLYPIEDHIPADADLTNPVLSLTMPQNDVDLAAEYVTRTRESRSPSRRRVPAPPSRVRARSCGFRPTTGPRTTRRSRSRGTSGRTTEPSRPRRARPGPTRPTSPASRSRRISRPAARSRSTWGPPTRPSP